MGNFGDHLKVKAGDVEFEVKTDQVTNDPQIATQAAQRDVRQRRQQNERAAQLLEDARATATPDSLSGDRYVELKYDSPEQLVAAIHKAARAKMFSLEEEKNELAKIPAGGELEVILYSITIETADPKWLTYVIGNSRGEVLEHKQGKSSVPSSESEFRWYGVDVIGLPTFNDELRVRIYHETFGEMGDYIIPRNAQPKRVR